MTTHELAYLLIELPDETVFVAMPDGQLLQVKDVDLWRGGPEVAITLEEF